ncbi:hypothetical protein [Rathayibacter sp. AY1H2]|uniref:hypothetical protein n=1 Tax=Rathayibacter sp. AY1H2 TaxID=2080566 RepID=UPI000CE90E16|nr:hypothetical protein [Rathayibacter sp. AY1H2]PPG85488.1 hypothetical protein C5C29_06025 [Rathayibacter sp. AY1H2]
MKYRAEDGTIVDLPVEKISHLGIRQAAENFFALDAQRRILRQKRDDALEALARADDETIVENAERIRAGKKTIDPLKRKREAQEAVDAAQSEVSSYGIAVDRAVGELRGVIRSNRKEWGVSLLADATAARDTIAGATREVQVALGEYQTAAGLLEMLQGDLDNLAPRNPAGVVPMQSGIESLRQGVAEVGRRVRDLG